MSDPSDGPVASGSRPYARDLSVFDSLSLPGPSDLVNASSADSDDEDEATFEQFETREKEYHDLHDQIQASADLLTNLSSFLSTFQTDLSSVSGEIKDLQERSKAIERRGGGRRTIEKPLRSLVDSITFPPPLVTLIMDSPVSDAWMPAIERFETILDDIGRRKGRVKAAAEAEKIGDGLRITAATKIRQHLLSLLTPLSTSVTINLPILQTSILLRHRPLFVFLLRRAPNTAAEIRRSYIWRARGYHETGFRRYARAVGLVKARWTETPDLIGSLSTVPTSLSPASAASNHARQPTPLGQDSESSLLASASIDGEGVMLAFQADAKDFVLPPEALFRSIMLVLLDNASAEYTFLVRFFSRPPPPPRAAPSGLAPEGPDRRQRLMSETPSEWGGAAGSDGYAAGGGLERRESSIAGDRRESSFHGPGMERRESSWMRRESSFTAGSAAGSGGVLEKDEKTEMEGLWHSVFDPALTYCQTLITTLLTTAPTPTLPSLLAMIRLNDALLEELTSRSTTPLESFVFSQRMALWPTFQKLMSANVDSLKKVADTAGTGAGVFGALGAKTTVKDGAVEVISNRYTSLFNSIIALASPTDEAMLFGSLTRLRTEMARLVVAQAGKIKDTPQREAFTSTIYDGLVQRLRVAFGTKKTEDEIEFWEGVRKRSG